MPDFMSNLAGGINGNVELVEQAASRLSTTLANSITNSMNAV